MLLAPVSALFYALLSQKLAPSEKNSTDMSVASAAFCISDFAPLNIVRNQLIFVFLSPSV